MLNIFSTRTMMRAIEIMPPVHTYIRDTFFPMVDTFPTKTVEIDIKKGKRRLAPFVNPKIGGKTVENMGYKTMEYTPPMVAPDMVTTAEDLMTRMAGENPYSNRTPAQRGQEKVGKDLQTLNEMITRREEWMAAQTIFTGKIPVIGEGVDEEIDFNFTNKETLAGTNLWDNEASDPLQDLEKWKEDVQKKGFVNVDTCIMASDVVNVFINHPKVKDMLDNRRIIMGMINPQELPSGVTYIGRLNKLGMDIYQYNALYLDDWTDPDEPVDKKLVPEKTVTLLSSNANYTMAYGAITLIDPTSEDFYTVEGDRVPYSWTTKKPAARFISVSSRPLPIPNEVDSWFVATVLA